MPPSAPPFIGREDLGDLLGEDLTASDAALVAIDAACDICRSEAWQTFNQVNDDEVLLDGSGTDALVLKEFPVTEVSSVAVGDDELTVDDDYKLNGNGTLIRLPYSTAKWTKGRQNVAVTYDHGYADDDFPRDVRVVALQVAARIFRQQASSGIQSETLGSYSVSYITSQAAKADLLTEGELRVLRKYRRT